MANNYDRYLRSMGIKTPYEDMTKAQIEDRNKGNPLSGYGFMSAQDKQRRKLEMAMYEREMKRQDDALQQQLVARMSSQGQIGRYAGEGVFGLVNAIRNKGKGQQAPEAAPQDDPEIARFNELAQQVGPDAAMEMLAAETGNPQMMQDAQKSRMEAKKANLEMEDLQGKIADRKAKPNETIKALIPGPDGVPVEQLLETVMGENGENLYKVIRQGPRSTVNYNVDGLPTSKAGVNTRTLAIEGALQSTANALDAYDRMSSLVDENPEALGWSGRLIANADKGISGVKNLGKAIANAEGREVTASMDVGNYKWGKLEKVASQSEKMKSLVLQLAYAQAAATGDSSRSLSDRDVQNQIDVIGGQITNPNSFKELMQQNKEILVDKLENMGKYTKIDGKSIGESYGADIQGLVERVRPKKASKPSGGTVRMKKGDKWYNIPEEKAEAAEASGYTRG
jgi:hypothetical protein